MRLVALADGSSGLRDDFSGSQLWSQHDIVMQRQVQRRGGELAVLTASGTEGRVLAPRRVGRWERLVCDMAYQEQQQELLRLALEDVDLCGLPTVFKKLWNIVRDTLE